MACAKVWRAKLTHKAPVARRTVTSGAGTGDTVIQIGTPCTDLTGHVGRPVPCVSPVLDAMACNLLSMSEKTRSESGDNP